MPRDGRKVRRRLQEAALELYGEHGYDQTTTAEIAAKAGVTERTFFRHFPDKREVLFDGEGALSTILTEAVLYAPSALGPWATLFKAFQSATDLLVANRCLAEPRRRIIARNRSLQERELMKAMSMSTALALALQERGVPDRLAAFSQAFSSWLEDGVGDLDEHLARAFRNVSDMSLPG
jgi:AcrR family transcriptional regulator